LAELGEQPVRSDRRPYCYPFGVADFRRRAEGELRQRAEEIAGLDHGGVREQPAQMALDRIGLAQRVEPGLALVRGDGEDLIEAAADRRPVGGEKLKIGDAVHPEMLEGSCFSLRDPALGADIAGSRAPVAVSATRWRAERALSASRGAPCGW